MVNLIIHVLNTKHDKKYFITIKQFITIKYFITIKCFKAGIFGKCPMLGC